jgi:hypothetical protein
LPTQIRNPLQVGADAIHGFTSASGLLRAAQLLEAEEEAIVGLAIIGGESQGAS